MRIRNVTFNKKIFYNFIKLDTVYVIKLAKIIKILNFKPPIIKNPPCNIDFEDDKIIKPIEDIQRNQPNAGLFEKMEKQMS